MDEREVWSCKRTGCYYTGKVAWDKKNQVFVDIDLNPQPTKHTPPKNIAPGYNPENPQIYSRD